MTQQEAYVQGFRKVAEAYGVFPQKLDKSASMLSFPGRLVGRLLLSGSRSAKRLLELLLGGNKHLLADYNHLQKWLDLSAKEAKKVTGGDPEHYKRLKDVVRTSFLKGNGQAVEIPLKNGGRRRITATKDVADELGKVWGARAGTALAGLGLAGGAGYVTTKDDKTKPNSRLF